MKIAMVVILFLAGSALLAWIRTPGGRGR